MNIYKRIILGEILNIKMLKIPCLWLVEHDLLNRVIRPAGRGSIFNKPSNTVKKLSIQTFLQVLKQVGSFRLNIDWEELPCI